MRRLKVWAGEEDDVLLRLCSGTQSRKWKKASQELRTLGFERSDAECRERFVNHLDPSVNKQLWQPEELETLYSKYGEYGNKWFLIQQHLPGRTQTKIKNYFYGNIRYLLKLILRTFLDRSPGFINDISTEKLVDIYGAQEEYEGANIISKTIKRLKYKVDRERALQIINEKREQFQQFLQCFLINQKLKPSPWLHSQPPQPPPEQHQSEEDDVLKLTCESVNSGVKKENELEYLKSMADYHLRCFHYYTQACARLQGDPE